MKKLIFILILCGGGAYIYMDRNNITLPTLTGKSKIITAEGRFSSSDMEIKNAYENRKRNVKVSGSGKIISLLPDDKIGNWHQRFTVLLGSGHTLMLTHNIDNSPRIPNPKLGDRIEFSGVYDWNSKGGVIYNTHYDPKGKNVNGWIKHNSRVYK